MVKTNEPVVAVGTLAGGGSQDDYSGLNSGTVEQVFEDTARELERKKKKKNKSEIPIGIMVSDSNDDTNPQPEQPSDNKTDDNTSQSTNPDGNVHQGDGTNGAAQTRASSNTGNNALRPGAVAVHGQNRNLDEEESSFTHNHLDNGSNGLAVANLVNEETLQPALPQARENDVDSNSRRIRQESNKKIKTGMLLGSIFMIAATMVIVALSVKSQQDSLAPAEMPTSHPSEAPTYSLEGSILSLLPEDTVLAIHQDPDSPQSKAWDWILEDYNMLSYLSIDRIKQKFALATLYFATGGDEWANNENWLDHSIHECNWASKPDFAMKFVISQFYEGYLSGFLEPPPTGQCDENGSYQHLWLDQNNLVGSLPAEFYLLTSLKTVSTAFNLLHGQISTLIGQLTNLDGLAFSYTENAGTVPSEIGRLTNLHMLSLADSELQGSMPSELWLLTNLNTLALMRNPDLVFTIPSSIATFHKLKWFNVDDSGLYGTIPTEVGILSSLEFMTLFRCNLAGTIPTELGHLHKLRVFSLFENSLHGMLPTEIGKLTATSLLAFWGNKISGTIPSQLGLLTQLSVSNLKSNLLSGTIPTELGLLSGIQELEIQGNQLSGPIPSEFGHLSSIGHLTFANNSLSGSIPGELSNLQQSLHTLTLEGNTGLFGTIPEAVCNMNGTCVSTALDNCNPNPGLSFDCSYDLCGCDCQCNSGNNTNFE